MENLHLKNLKIDKNNLFFINYSVKQLIYQDNLIELDFFKFLKDTHLNHKNKKIIYYIYEQSKNNKLLLEQLLTVIKYDAINNELYELHEKYQVLNYNDKINDILTNALTQTIIFEYIFKKNEINNIYKSLIEYYDIDSNYNENIESTLLINSLYSLKKENALEELKHILANHITNQPKLITSKDKEYFTSAYYKLSSGPYNNTPYLYGNMYNGYHQTILLTLEKLNLIKLKNDWVL